VSVNRAPVAQRIEQLTSDYPGRWAVAPSVGGERSASNYLLSSCRLGLCVRLQTSQWDDDAGVRHWKTEIVVQSLEMLSGRGKKEYAKEAQAVASEAAGNGQSSEESAQEVVVAM
jgi:single-stranded DNA-binding protein